MRQKAQQSNHTFLLGTLALGILVIGIVLLFATLSFRLSSMKFQQETSVERDIYHFRLPAHFYPNGCSLYLNDSLFFSGTVVVDTLIPVYRVDEDNALFVVDHATDLTHVASLAEKKGLFRIELESGELVLLKE